METQHSEERKATLVIIDMQPGFPLSLCAVRPVIAQVRKAMFQGWPIIVVEFDVPCAGTTVDEIMDHLNGKYDHFTVVPKQSEDGSLAVVDACRRHGFETGRLRLCGVMTDDCVEKTALGLSTLLPNSRIEIIQSACKTWSVKYDWGSFCGAKNIVLAPE